MTMRGQSNTKMTMRISSSSFKIMIHNSTWSKKTPKTSWPSFWTKTWMKTVRSLKKRQPNKLKWTSPQESIYLAQAMSIPILGLTNILSGKWLSLTRILRHPQMMIARWLTWSWNSLIQQIQLRSNNFKRLRQRSPTSCWCSLMLICWAHSKS
jgi:hypothetical protein